jgi:hypothetical protein
MGGESAKVQERGGRVEMRDRKGRADEGQRTRVSADHFQGTVQGLPDSLCQLPSASTPDRRVRSRAGLT